MNKSPTPVHSYPLSALFVLIALCSVLAAMISPLARSVAAENTNLIQFVIAMVALAFIGLILGFIVGLFHYRRTRGAILGMSAGVLVGMISGPLMLSPFTAFPALLGFSFLGAIMLIVTGFILGKRSGLS